MLNSPHIVQNNTLLLTIIQAEVFYCLLLEMALLILM